MKTRFCHTILGTLLVKDPSAPPLWARFHEIKSNRPFFCDRDGVVTCDVEEIGL